MSNPIITVIPQFYVAGEYTITKISAPAGVNYSLYFGDIYQVSNTPLDTSGSFKDLKDKADKLNKNER